MSISAGGGGGMTLAAALLWAGASLGTSTLALAFVTSPRLPGTLWLPAQPLPALEPAPSVVTRAEV